MACESAEELSAEFILDKSIEASGGEDFFHSTITFSIDDLDYELKRDGLLTDFSLTKVADTVTYFSTYKGGLMTYYENDVEIPESMQSRKFLDARLDGFTFLTSIPHVFKENAVILERQDDVMIQQKPYHSLKITYKHQQDIEEKNTFFLYINPSSYIVEFIAFKFDLYQHFPNFQRLYNHRKINGILFSDYFSFYPTDQEVPLEQLYQLYNQREVREGTNIKYTDVTVEINSYE